MSSFWQPVWASAVDLWQQAATIWSSGGWGMIPLAIDGLFMFALGFHIHLRLSEKGWQSVPERVWRHWINHPEDRRGVIGELLDQVDGAHNLEQLGMFFSEVQSVEIHPFERDLRVMKICVAAAPLLGLLGTVTGMLSTFGALATGTGGEKTMALVAGGIFEALITTETGLILALPGIFFQYQLARSHDRYKAFLAHLETACTQKLYKKLRRETEAA
jgi:biopolymer transport protein ExbB